MRRDNFEVRDEKAKVKFTAGRAVNREARLAPSRIQGEDSKGGRRAWVVSMLALKLLHARPAVNEDPTYTPPNVQVQRPRGSFLLRATS